MEIKAHKLKREFLFFKDDREIGKGVLNGFFRPIISGYLGSKPFTMQIKKVINRSQILRINERETLEARSVLNRKYTIQSLRLRATSSYLLDCKLEFLQKAILLDNQGEKVAEVKFYQKIFKTNWEMKMVWFKPLNPDYDHEEMELFIYCVLFLKTKSV